MITLEQVDQLRKRTNCSYEEAKILLEKHNGDVLEAIVEFEKSKYSKSYSWSNGNGDHAEWKKQSGDFWKKLCDIIQKGFETKVVIGDKNHVLLEASVNIMLLLVILIPYITLPVILLLLILGYKVAIRKSKGDEVNLTSIVQEAADKFKGTPQPQHPQPPQPQPQATEDREDDYHEMTIE